MLGHPPHLASAWHRLDLVLLGVLVAFEALEESQATTRLTLVTRLSLRGPSRSLVALLVTRRHLVTHHPSPSLVVTHRHLRRHSSSLVVTRRHSSPPSSPLVVTFVAACGPASFCLSRPTNCPRTPTCVSEETTPIPPRRARRSVTINYARARAASLLVLPVVPRAVVGRSVGRSVGRPLGGRSVGRVVFGRVVFGPAVSLPSVPASSPRRLRAARRRRTTRWSWRCTCCSACAACGRCGSSRRWVARASCHRDHDIAIVPSRS